MMPVKERWYGCCSRITRYLDVLCQYIFGKELIQKSVKQKRILNLGILFCFADLITVLYLDLSFYLLI